MLRKYEELSAEVNLLGVIKARAVIDRYLNRTNLTYYSELSRLVGCETFVKHENHNPTGSFKIRGALNFFHHVSREELERGVLVATRGNYGLAMAWAGQRFDVPCTVIVPERNNPEINRIVESFGAALSCMDTTSTTLSPTVTSWSTAPAITTWSRATNPRFSMASVP
jgi:threonine dehydratase